MPHPRARLPGPNTADRATAFAGLDEKQRFVQALYLDVLGRAGVASELDFWVGVLNASGQGVVAKASNARSEARNRLVQTWYQTYLGRAGDASENPRLVRSPQKRPDRGSRPEPNPGRQRIFGPRKKLSTATGTDQERYVTALIKFCFARVPDASGSRELGRFGRSNAVIARSMFAVARISHASNRGLFTWSFCTAPPKPKPHVLDRQRLRFGQGPRRLPFLAGVLIAG